MPVTEIFDTNGNRLVINVDGTVSTKLVGSLPKSEMEDYGATVATRPLATDVPMGFVFEAVTSQEFWQSDGTNWVVI